MMYDNKGKFSLSDMQAQLARIFNQYVPEFPEELPLKLPVKKLTLPKIKVKE